MMHKSRRRLRTQRLKSNFKKHIRPNRLPRALRSRPTAPGRRLNGRPKRSDVIEDSEQWSPRDLASASTVAAITSPETVPIAGIRISVKARARPMLRKWMRCGTTTSARAKANPRGKGKKGPWMQAHAV